MTDYIETPRELLQTLFDLAIGSLDFGSGFWCQEDHEAVAAVADLLDVEMPESSTFYAFRDSDKKLRFVPYEFETCADTPVTYYEHKYSDRPPTHDSHVWKVEGGRAYQCVGVRWEHRRVIFEPLPCNRENMQEFIAALRSGAYTQQTGGLEDLDGDRFYNCCLGVACREAGLVPQLEPDSRLWLFEGNGADLPAEAQVYLGVYESDPLLLFSVDELGYPEQPVGVSAPPGWTFVYATSANDRLQKSFYEIADAFERTYITGIEEA